jgi:hypothetical protein
VRNVVSERMILEVIQRHAQELIEVGVLLDERFFKELGQVIRSNYQRQGLDPVVCQDLDAALAGLNRSWTASQGPVLRGSLPAAV